MRGVPLGAWVGEFGGAAGWLAGRSQSAQQRHTPAAEDGSLHAPHCNALKIAAVH